MANISHFTQTVNGISTTYDIHDANAVDLTSNQTVAGDKEFTGITTAHDLVPSATDTYNLGSSIAQWNNAYIKSLTINGVACGDILMHNASEFVTVSDLSTVATSGSYTDLSNKPTIPTVNNGTLTIQQNGVTVGTFTANQSTDTIVALTSGGGGSADLLPIGSYIQFAGSQAPDGFLVCNGGEISRTTYSALFAVIGTTYGSGDGSTTFNLPNLTDRFLQGSSISGTVKDAGLPNITGYFDSDGIVSNVGGAFAFSDLKSGAGSEVSTYWREGTIYFYASNSNSIYGASSTVQPPALTCLICIKY